MNYIKYFPSFYKLMKSGIKLNCDKTTSEYNYEYKNKLKSNDDKEDLYVYLFGYWPLNNIMYKIIRNNETKYMLYYHNKFITTLNNIFKDKY